MAKYGVYVYDLLKILGGVCPEGKQSKISILTMSTLIIHRKVTCCQTSVEQAQKKVKIGTVININMTNSNIVNLIKFDI